MFAIGCKKYVCGNCAGIIVQLYFPYIFRIYAQTISKPYQGGLDSIDK